ncbi:MAG: 50S ribosomal protein L6 [Candidatus Paceibacterota bacterium]|jgi:large subunit ribosomal protein L6
MSRLAKKPIQIPEKVTVTISNGIMTIKGPLGELVRTFPASILTTITGSEIAVAPAYKNLETKALVGTVASHIMNMVEGVTKGYEKRLVVEGIGYKFDIKGDKVTFNLGFSHPIILPIPKGLKVVSDKGVMVITGIDKEIVGSFASYVRSLKKPEPYKGKGVRYEGEVIRRKEGKKAA